jgi:hypothetical protein
MLTAAGHRLTFVVTVLLLAASCSQAEDQSSLSTQGHTSGVQLSTPMDVARAVSEDVATGMASVGALLEPAPADAMALVGVGLPEAMAAAHAQFSSPLEPASVALALYTDTVSHAAQQRLVYVFVFEGLNLPPTGGYGDTSPTTVHHELVMLIDAVTGQWILDTTFR